MALVVDCRKRDLKIFAASVTQLEGEGEQPFQIVLRHGLDMGNLPTLLEGGEIIRTDSPIILMGEYRARSSEGHVSVLRNSSSYGHRKVLIVGGLGPAFGRGGLRVLQHPIRSVYIDGPDNKVELLAGASNSNTQTAKAAWDGVETLCSVKKTSVFLTEGQSDHMQVIRFKSGSVEALHPEIYPVLPQEHRTTMFSKENIVRACFLGAGRKAVQSAWKEHLLEGQPPFEEILERSSRIMTSYLSGRGGWSLDEGQKEALASNGLSL